MAKYKMTIDLNVLNHLGLRLYSNVSAVLSETVANAWDADATTVHINVCKDQDDQSYLTIFDNGSGMDIKDINEKYLTVGYKKRVNGEATTPSGRAVMGRKGIGKLSLFSIAKTVEIYTVKGDQRNAFIMDTDEIERVITDGRRDYEPDEITDAEFNFDKGTKIVLRRLKKELRLGGNLRKRLARRFGIIGASNDFTVYVNGEPVTIVDRDYFHKVEYVWYFGKDSKPFADECTNAAEQIERPNEISVTGLNGDDGNETKTFEVTGWLGLVDSSSKLQDGDDNLNKIVLMMRNKMAQEDMLELYREGGLYTKFLFGEIYADFLDEDNLEDIATSSRQTIIQHDPRFKALKDFLKGELKHIQNERARLKEQDGVKDALQYEPIREWFGELPRDSKQTARKLFGKLNSVATDDRHRRELFIHGMLAFESLRYKDALRALDEIPEDSIESFLQLFDMIDDIEASLYYRITKERLAIIDKLKDHVHEENALEKILQAHLYNHLWLLDPSWDRATETPYMEQRVETEFDGVTAKLTEEEAKGRVDIKYKKASGKHIIIELKRASVRTTDNILSDQVEKYESALRKILNSVDIRERPPIEMICIVGHEPTNWNDDNRLNRMTSLAQRNIRIITYQKLIEDAYVSYQQYLNASKNTKRIIGYIEQLEAEFYDDLNPNDVRDNGNDSAQGAVAS